MVSSTVRQEGNRDDLPAAPGRCWPPPPGGPAFPGAVGGRICKGSQKRAEAETTTEATFGHFVLPPRSSRFPRRHAGASAELGSGFPGSLAQQGVAGVDTVAATRAIPTGPQEPHNVSVLNGR
jgi:hypothetical protein